MKFSISHLITTAMTLSTFTVNVYAGGQCFDGAKLYDAGYTISGNKLEILAARRPFKRNMHVNDDKVIYERVLEIIKNTRPEANAQGIKDTELADIITRASRVTGVSFAALTAVMQKESLLCQYRANLKGGGDSGCMQFTTIALEELRDQFGISGGHKSNGVSELLTSWADDFFEGQPERRQAFRAWINKSTEEQRAQLRKPGDEDLDIFAGAVLLKIKLAVAEGDYIEALENYNGSSKKKSYGKDAEERAYKVGLNCEAPSTSFADEILERACINETAGRGEEALNTCLWSMSQEYQAPAALSNADFI